MIMLSIYNSLIFTLFPQINCDTLYIEMFVPAVRKVSAAVGVGVAHLIWSLVWLGFSISRLMDWLGLIHLGNLLLYLTSD